MASGTRIERVLKDDGGNRRVRSAGEETVMERGFQEREKDCHTRSYVAKTTTTTSRGGNMVVVGVEICIISVMLKMRVA